MKLMHPPIFRSAALTIGLLGLASVAASATTIDWNNNYRIGNGGEFTLVGTGLDLSNYDGTATTGTSGIIGADSFQTFCIERDEFISQGMTVTFNLNTAAVAGGQGGPSPDPISQGTAWLYCQFAQGALTGYDYTPAPGGGRKASAGLLQNAIWYFEEEIILSDIDALNNPFIALAVNSGGNLGTGFGTLAAAMANHGTNGEDYGVFAVNLYTNNGNTLRQDQLYYSGGRSVPDGGATVMLFGLALGGLGLARALKRQA